MNDFEKQRRFDELDAARALGDLSLEEDRELRELIESGEFEADAGLDWIAASLETETVQPEQGTLREEVLSQIKSDADQFEREHPPITSTPDNVIPFWRKPALGWVAAACMALAFFVALDRDPNKDATPMASAAESRQALIDSGAAPLAFSPTDAFPSVTGDVVWSDDGQEGYMSLAGLPPNDPSVEQYQLWIVDPERDTAPVDGGVFDIGAAGERSIVAVRAALRVDRPVAFVITVEQPGGVVVSKQERVAGIAQRRS